EEVTAVIINVDRKSRGINLSVKAKDSAETQETVAKFQSESSAATGTTNLGALLKAKMEGSNS
ncbi:MAG: 30S ribosomal protein S1, partial [Janthinobacterium lividum]